MMQKIGVAVLGATGTVGQKVVALLAQDPHFYVAELTGSASREGKPYGSTIDWRDDLSFPEEVRTLICKSPLDIESPYIISALPADEALKIEPMLAQKGHIVVSNASAFRMDPKVPLLVPEINAHHLDLLYSQETQGKLITNPNCVVAIASLGLAPFLKLGSIKHIHMVTLQAASGAGYPGVPSLDLLGNTIPYIAGEEDKIPQELRKIFGDPIHPMDLKVSVQVNRVPVRHGHMASIQLTYEKAVHVEEALEVLQDSSYKNIIKVHKDPTRPQAALDLKPNEMRVHIGRVSQGEDAHILRFVVLGHNLVRGAAGAAIENLRAYLSFIND
jgi:aspartate-semialdehyde dehydrogenase